MNFQVRIKPRNILKYACICGQAIVSLQHTGVQPFGVKLFLKKLHAFAAWTGA